MWKTTEVTTDNDGFNSVWCPTKWPTKHTTQIPSTHNHSLNSQNLNVFTSFCQIHLNSVVQLSFGHIVRLLIDYSERIGFELNNNQQQVWKTNIIMKICRLKYLHPEAEPTSLTANTILIYNISLVCTDFNPHYLGQTSSLSFSQAEVMILSLTTRSQWERIDI